jgi:AcrR family transcriptional regulator
MSTAENSARAPQRERGRQRVAELLEAASLVFAEKGYAAATMTEIAARAQAPIGSLYQFFPNKEALGDALARRFGERTVEALAAIEADVQTLDATALAAALLRIFIDLRKERATMLAVTEALPDKKHSRGSEFRHDVLAAIARVLRLRAPKLPTERLDALSMLVLLQMKACIGVLDLQKEPAKAAATQRELGRMLALHLAENLDPSHVPRTRTAGAPATKRKRLPR